MALVTMTFDTDAVQLTKVFQIFLPTQNSVEAQKQENQKNHIFLNKKNSMLTCQPNYKLFVAEN